MTGHVQHADPTSQRTALNTQDTYRTAGTRTTPQVIGPAKDAGRDIADITSPTTTYLNSADGRQRNTGQPDQDKDIIPETPGDQQQTTQQGLGEQMTTHWLTYRIQTQPAATHRHQYNWTTSNTYHQTLEQGRRQHHHSHPHLDHHDWATDATMQQGKPPPHHHHQAQQHHAQQKQDHNHTCLNGHSLPWDDRSSQRAAKIQELCNARSEHYAFDGGTRRRTVFAGYSRQQGHRRMPSSKSMTSLIPAEPAVLGGNHLQHHTPRHASPNNLMSEHRRT